MKKQNYTTHRIVLFVAIFLGMLGSVNAQRRGTRVIDNKGTIKNVLDTSSHFVDTAANGLTKLNDSTLVLGGKLIQVTTLDINGQKLQLANLVSGQRTDSLVVADPITGELKRIAPSQLLNNLIIKNGLRKDGDTAKLGGALTEATTITATGTNSLTLNGSSAAGAIRITNLTSGATSDSLLVIDPATNNVRYIAATTLLRALQANNGLTKVGDTLQLGGNLIKNTTIGTNGKNLNISVGGSASDSLNITGLRSGNLTTDSIMVVNGATGKVGQVAVTQLLQSGETSFSATAGQTIYAVANMPAIPSKVSVFRNGAKLIGGSNSTVTSDYTVAIGQVTLVLNGYSIIAGDVIEVQWVK